MLPKKKIYDFTFYFKDDAVIMSYHRQFICFNNYSLRNKHGLHKFSDRIRKKNTITLNDVYGYAKEYSVPVMALSDDAAIRHNLERIN